MEERPLVAWTRRLGIVTLLMMLILVIFLLGLSTTVLGDDVTWGDTTVTDEQTHTWTNITLDGNLTVADEGILNLSQGRLLVNATSAAQYMIVIEEGGSLVLWNVSISSAGGTYGIEVRGFLDWELVTVEGLDREHHLPIVPRGLVVLGKGTAFFTDVEITNPLGYALYINDTGNVWMKGGQLYGASTAIRTNSNGFVSLNGTEVGADKGADLIILMGGAMLYARDCRFYSDDVYSSSIHDVTVFILGDDVVAVILDSTIATTELAVMNGGYLEIAGSTFEPDRTRGMLDLRARNADLVIENITMQEVQLDAVEIELRDATFISGHVGNASVVHSYGPVPPLPSLSNDTRINHHYWVDFKMLNVTGEAEERMDLTVITSEGGLVLNEAFSDATGMIRKVPVRSWTLVDDVLTYEPSHRLEFAGPSYQISNLQVFDNITVTLWDRVGSYDLVLNTDAVTPSRSAPEENRTFDIIVDGDVLIPYTWGSGTSLIDLYVNGELHERVSFSLTSRNDVLFQDLDLTAGRYIFRVVADPDDGVEEMNEGGNNEVRFILDVSPEGGTGELVDLTVEILRVGDTAGNSGEDLIPGILYIDYHVRAYNSKVVMRNVPVAVYVDDKMDDLVRVDLEDMEEDYLFFTGQFRVNLPRGTYVIKVIVDPLGEIDEEREHNNEDQATVNLDPEVGNGSFLDQDCCVSLFVFGLITAVGLLGAWAQRKQRLAAAEAGGTAQYGGAPMSPHTGPGMQASIEQTPWEPVSLDESWRVEQSGAAYTADGWEEGVADRIIAPGARPPPSRERYQATDLTCPRCKGRKIMGFSDGSAKCQSCKKIFYPGRRY